MYNNILQCYTQLVLHKLHFWQEFDLFRNSFFNTKTLSISDILLPVCGKAVDL